jgi:hypothetical protein
LASLSVIKQDFYWYRTIPLHLLYS